MIFYLSEASYISFMSKDFKFYLLLLLLLLLLSLLLLLIIECVFDMRPVMTHMQKTKGNFWKLVLSYDHGFQRLKSKHQACVVSATETSHQPQDFFVVVLWVRVSPCSLGCLGTHFTLKAAINFMAFLPQSLEFYDYIAKGMKSFCTYINTRETRDVKHTGLFLQWRRCIPVF